MHSFRRRLPLDNGNLTLRSLSLCTSFLLDVILELILSLSFCPCRNVMAVFKSLLYRIPLSTRLMFWLFCAILVVGGFHPHWPTYDNVRRILPVINDHSIVDLYVYTHRKY